MRKTLLVLRHGKSSWEDASLQDIERPLNKRGKRDAPRMGKLLAELGLIPDLIISSNARRANDTAKAVSEYCGYQGIIELGSSFYSADLNAYLEALRLVPDRNTTVLIVGHNPAVEDLVLALTKKITPMQTCALARIDLEIDRWRDLDKNIEGNLMKVWRPSEL